MSNQAELSNYMQFVKNIQSPGNIEDRGYWKEMRPKVLNSMYSFIFDKRECDCPCGRDFFSHMIDLEENPEFRKHFLMMANVLQRYPELASSFVQAACIRMSTADWPTIEDNAAHQKSPNHLNQ